MAAVNLIGSYNYVARGAFGVHRHVCVVRCSWISAKSRNGCGGWSRALWVLGGASAMGTGIWSMHYTRDAWRHPTDFPWPTIGQTVLLSLLAAILASVVALYVVGRQKMSASRAVAGSLLMGAGIASMHYIGMSAAMRLTGDMPV